jgi:hypothetical protein
MVDLGSIVVRYPKGTMLARSHRLTLAIIRDSIRQRPIYFATTTGAMTDLGLQDWGVRQGLATKLVILPQEQLDAGGFDKGPVELGSERFDVPRSLDLFDHVYLYRGLRDRLIWTDRSTLNIPWQYYALGLQLADAAQRHHANADVVARLKTDAANFQLTAEGGLEGRTGS